MRIEIKLENMDADQGGHTKVGPTSEPIYINSDFVNDYNRIKDIALHEFGHKFGLTHEQSHPDSTCDRRQTSSFLWWEWESGTEGKSFFPYDANSVMNYCQKPNVGLSPGDIDGIQRLYGGNEYLLSDNRKFWLRSDHGPFLRGGLVFAHDIFSDSLFHFTNVGRKGQDVQFGHQVQIRNDRGSYLSASSGTNRRTGVVSYSLSLSSTPFNWDVSGFHTGGVNVNKPIHFSAVLSNQRAYLAAGKNIKNGAVSIGVGPLPRTATLQHSNYVWRVLGPGPETASVCEPGLTRCGSKCCGNGSVCADASIDLCCGEFEEHCGNVCCDLDEACVAGRCQVPAVPPQTPGTSCGAFPACSTIDDCPAAFDYCNGCCRRLN